jgi:hypothetical protein
LHINSIRREDTQQTTDKSTLRIAFYSVVHNLPTGIEILTTGNASSGDKSKKDASGSKMRNAAAPPDETESDGDDYAIFGE